MRNAKSMGLATTLALAGLMLASSPALAKTLAWKFKAGDKLQYAISQKGDININAGGVELEIKTKQIMDLTWTVKTVAADGSAEVGQTVDRVQLKLSTPFTGDFAYDSKSGEMPEGQVWQMLGPFMEGMLGQEFTMKVTPQGHVSDIALPAKLTEILKAQAEQGGGGGGRAMMMGGGFSEDSIKELIARAVVQLPAGEVTADSKWEQHLESPLGPMGTMMTDVSHSYLGSCDCMGKKVDKIGITSKLSLEASEDENADIEMELTEQEGSGEVLFDADAGRIVNATSKQKMVMEGDFMGNEFVQDRTTELLMVAGTSDNLPAEPEPEATAEGDDKEDADEPGDTDEDDKDGDDDDKEDDDKDGDK